MCISLLFVCGQAGGHTAALGKIIGTFCIFLKNPILGKIQHVPIFFPVCTMHTNITDNIEIDKLSIEKYKGQG